VLYNVSVMLGLCGVFGFAHLARAAMLMLSSNHCATN